MYLAEDEMDDYTTGSMDVHIRADKMIAVANEFVALNKKGHARLGCTLEFDIQNWQRQIEDAGALTYEVAVDIARDALGALGYACAESEYDPAPNGLTVVELVAGSSESDFDKGLHLALWSVFARNEAVESTVSVMMVPHIQFVDKTLIDTPVGGVNGEVERWVFAHGNVYENNCLIDSSEYL